ncbi:MAG: GAF domain-containing protein [Candidatus Omnitrophota bacterium]|nr:GAF domain-containing protein [Candidatus Omnitrophota bacterium]MBU2528562.1 GAF domain-containing protein [bacterium]MBU3930052.1 GAF domain-containing protein [bacterium]MBU4123498.1 GAF domain-containing protein [bacterium]
MNHTEVITVKNLGEKTEYLLKFCLSSICAILSSDGGSIMLVDDDGKNLTVAAAAGSNKHDAIGKKVVVGERVSGKAAKTMASVLIKGEVDVNSDKHFRGMKKYENISSGMSVPFIKNGKARGVINIKRTEQTESLTQENVETVEIIARELALAL